MNFSQPEITPEMKFHQQSIEIILLNLQSPFVGQLDHTGYPNLHPGVLGQTDLSGRRDGDLRTQMIHIRTTINPRNFILMQ